MQISMKSFSSYLIVVTLTLTSISVSAQSNPKERINYWRSNYQELTSEQDPRVSRAQEIFQRIKAAAGVGRSSSPRLHILAEDPYNISLPIAIRDGWVVLSKKVLDICYQTVDQGDAKLAFVLGHEVSHILYDSLLHVDLFTALDEFHSKQKETNQVVNNLKELISKPEHFAYKELEADEKGIIFAAMAGYDTSVVVSDEKSDSFFRQWQQAQNVGRLVKVKANDSHPVTELRRNNVLKQLRTVENRAQLFNVALLYYQAGDFKQAISKFEQFSQYFSSREVYHNLASSYHQLALQLYRQGTDHARELPFKFALVVDPDSRAIGLSSSRVAEQTDEFSSVIYQAIEYYKKAIELDADYLLSYINLGAAYIINEQHYDAIALLQKAVKKWPNNVDLLNALGVAFYSIDKSKQAITLLEKAYKIKPNENSSLYNLGKIAYSLKDIEAANKHWLAYLEVDGNSYWARLIRNKYHVGNRLVRKRGLPTLVFENVNGVEIADFQADLPKDWFEQSLHSIDDSTNKIIQYKNGIKAVIDGDAIRLLQATDSFTGKSNKGIAIGDTTNPVLTAYGLPAAKVATTMGDSWIYPDKGISFQFRNNKVISWLIY